MFPAAQVLRGSRAAVASAGCGSGAAGFSQAGAFLSGGLLDFAFGAQGAAAAFGAAGAAGVATTVVVAGGAASTTVIGGGGSVGCCALRRSLPVFAYVRQPRLQRVVLRLEPQRRGSLAHAGLRDLLVRVRRGNRLVPRPGRERAVFPAIVRLRHALLHQPREAILGPLRPRLCAESQLFGAASQRPFGLLDPAALALDHFHRGAGQKRATQPHDSSNSVHLPLPTVLLPTWRRPFGGARTVGERTDSAGRAQLLDQVGKA